MQALISWLCAVNPLFGPLVPPCDIPLVLLLSRELTPPFDVLFMATSSAMSAGECAPPLLVTPSLRAYYERLVAAQPTLSSISIACSPVKGRYLTSARAVAPASLLFTEPAVLCASDDPSVCVACHSRHSAVDGRAVPCSGFRALRYLRSAINDIAALAQARGYGESRGLMLADWIAQHLQQQQQRSADGGAEAAPPPSAAPPPTLAALFAQPAPVAPSFALPQPQLPPSPAPTASAPSPRNASAALSPSAPPTPPVASAPAAEASLSVLGLSALWSLDCGPPSLSSEHCAFASAVWRALPLSVRRSVSLSSLVRLLCILELNAHELVDDAGEKGEGLFPFFALIEHSCWENCAFTALTPHQGCGPAVSVVAIRAIAAATPLSINYAPPYQPTALRRVYLARHYHFHCTCPVCEGAVPDRCRAFRCGASGCAEPVWVWGEGREEDGLTAWRCSSPACTAPVTAERVVEWREAEAFVGAEVQRALKAVEGDAAAAEDSDGVGERRESRARDDIRRLAAVLRLHLTDTLSADGSEQPTDAGDAEGGTDAAEPGAAPPSSACPPPSRSQLKNRRRRTKRKSSSAGRGSASAAALLASRLHSSHYHVHALLELLGAFYAHEKEWERAVRVARVRLRSVQRLMAGDGPHWLEAAEWRALATWQAESGDAAGSRDSFAQCYRISRHCFGEHAASTAHASSRMESAQREGQ